MSSGSECCPDGALEGQNINFSLSVSVKIVHFYGRYAEMYMINVSFGIVLHTHIGNHIVTQFEKTTFYQPVVVFRSHGLTAKHAQFCITPEDQIGRIILCC